MENFKDFNDIKAQPIDIEKIKSDFASLSEKMTEAKDASETIAAIREYFKLSDHIMTDLQIIEIHFTQDTNNEEYQKMQEEADKNTPLIQDIINNFEILITSSKHIEAIKEEFGELFVKRLELSQKTFSKEIISDCQEENRLVSKYNAIIASADIEFEGQRYNLSRLSKFTQSLDRETRKKASAALNKFYEDNDAKIGEIYNELVQLRTKIAKKLGYDSFIPVAYARLGRLDYDDKDVATYRDQILKYVVPVTAKIFKNQMKRIGIDDYHYYDTPIQYLDGNPEPLGTTEMKIDRAEQIYHEMDPYVGSFFTFLKDHKLLDLETRPGKQGGGYMCYLPDLSSSFIFSNFNNTSHDIDVLTHEFGHALQGFLSSSYEVPSYRSPGYECCEIHSMSMEFLASPYVSAFFDEKNVKKYHHLHLASAITFLPYGVSVDEFQHRVYAKPDMTHAERKAIWREIEKKYIPSRKYGEDCPFLEEGGFWLRQGHIFGSPFYYIDYTIAQVVSFQFYIESLEDYKKALNKYLDFCRLGGRYDYKELLAKGGLTDPMKEGVLKDLMPKLEALVEQYEKELD